MMDTNKRIFLVYVLFLSSVCIVRCSPHQDSYKGWTLQVSSTQWHGYHDNKDVRLRCWLKPFNSSISVGWYEGLSTVGSDVLVIQDTDSVDLMFNFSLRSYGKYTCKAFVLPNVTLEADTWLLPEGKDSSLVQNVWMNHSQIYNMSCQNGRLWKRDLANESTDIAEVNGNVFSFKFTALSNQFKLVCLADSGMINLISYVLPNAEPIRFISPGNSAIYAADSTRLHFSCKAEGFPVPKVTFTKRNGEALNYPTLTSPDGAPNCLNVFYRVFHSLWNGGPHKCVAVNVWEDVKFNVLLTSQEIPLKPLQSSVQNFTATPPIVEVGGAVTLTCIIDIREDLILNLYSISGDKEKQEIVSRTISNTRRQMELHHMLSVTASTSSRYTCSLIKIKFRIKESPLDITIADRALLTLKQADKEVTIDRTVNVSAIFSVYPGVKPTVSVFGSFQGHDGFFLETIASDPVLSWSGEDLHVAVLLDPSLAENISLITTESLRSTLVIQVSYYYYSTEALVNVTIPHVEPSVEADLTINVVGGVTGVMVVIAMVVLILTCATFWIRRQTLKQYNELNISPQQRMQQRLLAQVSGEMKPLGLLHASQHLELGEALGEGSFGVVYSGNLTIKGETIQVAAKTIKDSLKIESLEEFVKELRMLQKIGTHPHIISLVGCCVQQDTLYILLEYASGGRLLSYLHKKRPNQLSRKDKVNFSLQIAKGMEYLASRKCVHCDLAARNVLLMEDSTLKVCDFGLARRLYQEVYHKNIKSDTRLPIKWMALESIERQEFHAQSDVWAFGVLLWEIASLGRTPYPLVTSQQQLLRMLREGKRLDHPEHCPEPLWTIMRSCWLPNPDDRPTFIQLVAMLKDLHFIDEENSAKEKETMDQLTQLSLVAGYDSSIDGDGYCSYCKAKLEEDSDSDGVSIDQSCLPEQPQPPPEPAVLKPAAKRVDSGDSGICHNCKSECGSTFSMGQSLMTGGYTGGFSSVAGSSYYTGGGYISGGSSITYNPQHETHPQSSNPSQTHLLGTHPHRSQPLWLHPQTTPTATHPVTSQQHMPPNAQVYYRSHPQQVQVGVVESDV